MKTVKGIQFISPCLFAVRRGICNILRHLLSQCWRVGGHKLWNGTLKHSVMHLKTVHLTAEHQAGDIHTDDMNTVSVQQAGDSGGSPQLDNPSPSSIKPIKEIHYVTSYYEDEEDLNMRFTKAGLVLVGTCQV